MGWTETVMVAGQSPVRLKVKSQNDKGSARLRYLGGSAGRTGQWLRERSLQAFGVQPGPQQDQQLAEMLALWVNLMSRGRAP